ARIAIQGTGHVGAALAALLAECGAELLLADPVVERVEVVAAATGGTVLDPDALPRTACDVFAPCGLGGVLDDALLPALRCRVVAGAANNQLATPDVASDLARRGVLYVPDFLLNAGGVIHAALAWSGAPPEEVSTRVEAIGATVAEVLAGAERRGLLPLQVAAELAAARLEGAATS
ncbi:MAG: amino acid dehydrogenase, partial [Pseudomonadales bacterium]|nr:amino acid dehydrogenase [Pseudomonadales bacterium]